MTKNKNVQKFSVYLFYDLTHRRQNKLSQEDLGYLIFYRGLKSFLILFEKHEF